MSYDQKYRPEIDGLRALAVLPVIFFHAGFEWFSGGFVGVDVFFVISGYLISTIIMNELDNGTFSFINFYERRARRILPPLYFTILVVMPIVYLYFPPHSSKDFYQSSVAAVAFLSNYFFYIETDYFNQFTDTSPLIHTWSLAIEEQFYFILPATLVLLKRWSVRIKLSIFSFFVILSFIYSIYLSEIDPSLSYYHSLSRFWEILCGVCLGLYTFKSAKTLAPITYQVLSSCGLAILISSFVVIDETGAYPNFFSLLPVLGTSLIILTAKEGTFTHALLSKKPLVFIGLLSYSLYLWHQPIFAIYRQITLSEIKGPHFFALLIPIFIFSLISYFLVENYFRDKRKVSRANLFISLGVISGLILSIGIFGHTSNGFFQAKINGLSESDQLLLVNTDAIKADREVLWGDLLNEKKTKFETDKHKILVLGDSKGEDLFVSMNLEEGFRNNYEFSYLRWDNDCMSSYEDLTSLSEICEEEGVTVYASDLLADADTLFISNTWTYFSNSNVTKAISQLSATKKIYVFSTANFNDMAAVSYEILTRGIDDAPGHIFKNIRDDWRYQSEQLAKSLKPFIAVEYIDKLDLLCDLESLTCDILRPTLIWDSGHLSVAGARVFGTRLFIELQTRDLKLSN